MRAKVNFLTASVLGAFAALLLSACSSKNPDSLVGVNVDENLAIMDENASSNAIAAATNDAEARDTSADSASDGNKRSGTIPGKASSPKGMDEPDRPTGVNAIAPGDAPDQDEVGTPANDNEETAPNAL